MMSFGLMCLVLFLCLAIIGIIKRPGSIYRDEPGQKNPMEGKMVVFVVNDEEPQNADGARGHLDAIGISNHKQSVYERVVKRSLDIVLSFGALVLLSPVFLVIIIWIKIDDPGPVLFKQKRIGKDKQYFALHKFRSMKLSSSLLLTMFLPTCWRTRSST